MGGLGSNLLRVRLAPGHHISGSDILKQVVAVYSALRLEVRRRERHVCLVRFACHGSHDSSLVNSIRVAAISMRQKRAAFSAAGYIVDEHILAWGDGRGLADAIFNANENPLVAAIIVQMPIPADLQGCLSLLDSKKDIDNLRRQRVGGQGNATADGIARLARSITPNLPVTVLGAQGFVGRDLCRLLRMRGHEVLEVERGDDLGNEYRSPVLVSVVGTPGIVTKELLGYGPDLVIDGGFSLREGAICGDVSLDARAYAKRITPVPGGVGPIEMAVLVARVLRADFGVPDWNLCHAGL